MDSYPNVELLFRLWIQLRFVLRRISKVCHCSLNFSLENRRMTGKVLSYRLAINWIEHTRLYIVTLLPRVLEPKDLLFLCLPDPDPIFIVQIRIPIPLSYSEAFKMMKRASFFKLNFLLTYNGYNYISLLPNTIYCNAPGGEDTGAALIYQETYFRGSFLMGIISRSRSNPT